jgi:hypothetical protein
MDANVLLASITKWEDMGCTPGTPLGYSLPPRTHEMQKPSASQGLYQILLLALLAVTTSVLIALKACNCHCIEQKVALSFNGYWGKRSEYSLAKPEYATYFGERGNPTGNM